MITEEQYDELTKKLEKFYEWAKKTNKRIEELEYANSISKHSSTPRSNLVNARLWTKEEEEVLVKNLRNKTPLRPALQELEDNWERWFGYPRTYDALRKKYKRLTA